MPSDPSDAVAQALDARLQDGFSFDMRFDLTEAGRASMEAEDEQLADLLGSGLLSGAFKQPDLMSLSFGDGAVELRTATEAIYFRIDLQALADLTGDEMDMPSASDLQAQLGQMGISGELAAVAQAALEGKWVGITGLTEEAMAGLQQSLGGFAPTPDPQASEDLRDALEAAGLLDGEELTDRYLIVTGDDGTYDVEVKARALITALHDVASDLEAFAEGFTSTDLPDPADVPEQIGGVTITLDGDEVDTIALDLVEMGSDFDAEAMAEEDLAEGDVIMVVDFDDVDDSQVGEPEGAVTVTFEQLFEGLAPLFMGLLGGGLGGEY